jgi:Bacteriophage tail sheath protein
MMMALSTPGVYFEHVDRGRPAIGPLRTDIAGFVGYTERGPLLLPVKLTSWREYVALFGEPLAVAHLGEAVRGFFANGGATCYVVRVAHPDDARAATVSLRDATGASVVQLTASHGRQLDPRTGQPVVVDGKPVRYDSPGAWGGRLAVEVLPDGAGNAEARPPQPPEGTSTAVDSLRGFQAGSIVTFVQDGLEAPAYRRVTAITPHLLQLEWDRPLLGLGLDLTRPFRLETREFSLRVLLDGQIVETHEGLSLSAEHARYAVDVVQAESRYLDAEFLGGPDTLTDPRRWPVTAAPQALTGGRDGLVTARVDDFLLALEVMAEVDEVSLLAAPDAVLRAVVPEATPPAPREPDCENLEPMPAGVIRGLVVTPGEDGGDQPVAGAHVTPLSASAASVTSGADGGFRLAGLPEGHVGLRLERDGFHMLETTAQSRAGATEVARFTLAPITTPPVLTANEVFRVQEAMALQGERGLYRVALLDPPEDQLKLDQVQTWRKRFDTAFAAMYYPWLVVGAAGDRLAPPSGHVAGLIARTDLSQGVHRAPANYTLEGVTALSNPLNETEHGILNDRGINAIRALPGRGIRIFGARTLSSESEWRYLNVRRLLLMIEEAVEDANQWAVFEPNNPLLRQILTHNLNSFLDTLWRQGALAGSTPDAAYRVKCDFENNPQGVIDAGQLIAEIAVAPAVPFEFIRFRLGRTVAAVSVTE